MSDRVSNDGRNRNQRTPWMASASLICTIIGLLSACFVVFTWIVNEAFTLSIGYMICFPALALCIVAVLLVIKIGVCNFSKICSAYSATLRLFLPILCILIMSLFLVRYPAKIKKHMCAIHLRNLSAAMLHYSNDYGSYPAPNEWCDVLVKYTENNESRYGKYFKQNLVCPGADNARCNYAMNPNAIRSGQEIVLLFECEGGWNLCGGAELVTFKNHKNKGCNILFVNGSIRFVSKIEFEELKW